MADDTILLNCCVLYNCIHPANRLATVDMFLPYSSNTAISNIDI